MRRYLIIANQTLGSAHLRARIAACMAAGPCRFHIVVPATPSSEHLTWTHGEARAVAVRRLEAGLEQLGAMGAVVSGEVGDGSPMLAVGDVLRTHDFDAILLSTHAPGASRWLRQDLPARMRRAFRLPIEHVAARAEHQLVA